MKNFVIDQNLKELTEHRTVELPVACYNTTINQNINGYIPLHWHDEIQFVLILKGIALFQINEEKIEVHEGDGLFINSGTPAHGRRKGRLGLYVYLLECVTPFRFISGTVFKLCSALYVFNQFVLFIFGWKSTVGKKYSRCC
nr:cupin domain-containing protein [Bacillus subtilis]